MSFSSVSGYVPGIILPDAVFSQLDVLLADGDPCSVELSELVDEKSSPYRLLVEVSGLAIV